MYFQILEEERSRVKGTNPQFHCRFVRGGIGFSALGKEWE